MSGSEWISYGVLGTEAGQFWGPFSIEMLGKQSEGYETCDKYPNLFTPNADGINDYTQFEFDRIGYSEAKISIFDIRGIQVCAIHVPSGSSAKQSARWDGCDDNGKPLPHGLYLYVIESEGKIVCEGTITLAR